jgi:hypothetical protein
MILMMGLVVVSRMILRIYLEISYDVSQTSQTKGYGWRFVPMDKCPETLAVRQG